MGLVNVHRQAGVSLGVTATKFRLSHVIGLVLGLALLIGVPTIGNELRSSASDNQAAGRGAAARQTQTPPATKPPEAPNAAQRGGGSGPPGPLWEWEWWKDAEVQKELGLADAKVKNITRIFDERVKRSQALAEKFEKERTELNRLTEERKVSVEDYRIQVTQVEALRVELNKERTVMVYRISLQLTPEQIQKLSEIRERRRAMRGGRGRGTGSRH